VWHFYGPFQTNVWHCWMFFKRVYDIILRSFSTNIWHGLILLLSQCLKLLNFTDFIMVNIKLSNFETMAVKKNAREISLDTKVSSAKYPTQGMTFTHICFKTSFRGVITLKPLWLSPIRSQNTLLFENKSARLYISNIVPQLQINRSSSSDDNHMGYQLRGVVDEVEAGQ